MIIRKNKNKKTQNQITMTQKYVALIRQFSEGTPELEILENTIGDIVWSRRGIGDYRGFLAGAFTEVKTTCFMMNNVGPGRFHIIDWWDADNIFINTFLGTEKADGLLQNTLMVIEVYP